MVVCSLYHLPAFGEDGYHMDPTTIAPQCAFVHMKDTCTDDPIGI